MKNIFLIAVALVAVSCGNSSGNNSTLINKGAIMNGSDVKNDDQIKNHVVAVIDLERGGICTGTIIASNIVVTAAHCAPEKTKDLVIVFALDAYAMLNTLEPDFKRTYTRSVSHFKYHEGYNPENDTREEDVDDIAILKFRGELPDSYAPAPFLTLADRKELNLGKMAIVAGYGVNDVKTTKINPRKYPKLEEAIAYGEVICNDNLTLCMTVESTGEGLLRKGKAPIFSKSQKEVVLDEKRSGTCNGDSGGPAFIFKDNKYYLFGVTSRGGALCDDEGVYTNALEYIDWIEETAASFN